VNDYRFGHIPHLAVKTGEKDAWISVGMTVDMGHTHILYV